MKTVRTCTIFVKGVEWRKIELSFKSKVTSSPILEDIQSANFGNN